MKKIVVMMLVLGFLVGSVELAVAAEKKKKKKAEETKELSAEELKKKADEEAAAQRAKKKEAEQKAKETLSAQEWVIYLTSLTKEKAKIQNDVLNFSDGKITSRNLSAKGYPTSNYTLTLQETGVIVWETMQASEEGVAFWRGELKDSLMQGVLSNQPKKGEPEDLVFTTVNPEAKAEPEKAKTEPEKAAVQPPAEQPKKKGKK